MKNKQQYRSKPIIRIQVCIHYHDLAPSMVDVYTSEMFYDDKYVRVVIKAVSMQSGLLRDVALDTFDAKTGYSVSPFQLNRQQISNILKEHHMRLPEKGEF